MRVAASALALLISINTSAQGPASFSDRRFTYTLELAPAADSAQADCSVRSIRIRRKGGNWSQKLTPPHNDAACVLPPDLRLVSEDLNFDGHPDLRLLQHMPEARHLSYFYWRWSPKAGCFLRDTALDVITSPGVDRETRTLTSF